MDHPVPITVRPCGRLQKSQQTLPSFLALQRMSLQHQGKNIAPCNTMENSTTEKNPISLVLESAH
jgi:hypothetical protein